MKFVKCEFRLVGLVFLGREVGTGCVGVKGSMDSRLCSVGWLGLKFCIERI